MPSDDWYQYNSQFAKPGDYQTKLSPDDEEKYRAWMDKTRKETGTDLNNDDPGYDMRGYWQSKGKNAKPMDTGQHFPDTYKTPYHPTFSRESKYATKNAPFWRDDVLIDPATGMPTPGFVETERLK